MKHPTETDYFGMTIPDYMAGGLIGYIERGIPPGGFLTKVIENDLDGAVSYADSTNIRNIPAYVFYLYNYAPAACWGSKGNYDRWVASGGLKGREVNDA